MERRRQIRPDLGRNVQKYVVCLRGRSYNRACPLTPGREVPFDESTSMPREKVRDGWAQERVDA